MKQVIKYVVVVKDENNLSAEQRFYKNFEEALKEYMLCEDILKSSEKYKGWFVSIIGIVEKTLQNEKI